MYDIYWEFGEGGGRRCLVILVEQPMSMYAYSFEFIVLFRWKLETQKWQFVMFLIGKHKRLPSSVIFFAPFFSVCLPDSET